MLAVGAAAALLTIDSGSHKLLASHATPTIVLPKTPTTPVTPTTPSPGGGAVQTPATTLIGRTITWDGMQISTVQGIGAVIQTVGLRSWGDVAGLEPGDVIESIDSHPIDAAAQIASALRGVARGRAVSVSVERGSTMFATSVPFEGSPTTSP